jgi:glycolate oxidase FAD binding subunit
MTEIANVLERFSAQILDATATRQPLRLRGGDTKRWYGEAPGRRPAAATPARDLGHALDMSGQPDTAAVLPTLDTRAYSGIVEYDPAELVITARAGTPLVDIEAALAERGQMLPFEPPHFGAGATLGGCIAAGLAGPRRPYTGSPRDFVLGVELMDGRAQILNFGGRVMKNVAGYDVARLMAGSLGTLGLILSVSLKVLPRAVADATLSFECSQEDALARLNQWAGMPLPLQGSVWHRGVLSVRLSGARAAVEAAKLSLGGTLMSPSKADVFWQTLREHAHPFFAPAGQALWRIAVPPTTVPLDLGGDQLVEWGGGQRWLWADASASRAASLRETAALHGGHATLFRFGEGAGLSDENVDRDPNAHTDADIPAVFTRVPEPILDIHRRLKAAFDPAGIFNPGRMYRDL